MALNIRLTDKVSNVNEEDELRKRGYILGVTLGEGSYAKVKSAFSEKHDRKIALKIINRRKAPKDFQTRFLPRELEILKQIIHPNIIRLFDVMRFNNKVYMALEMAGHGDLLEYIKLRGAIPEEKSKRMFLQLASAVEYLHAKDIIHRDLKCENILLDGQNNLKLSDFGFARFMKKDDVSKTFCGSAAYAAPEILQGIPYSGFGYDVWSVGVILYIMVCGSMPYDDSNIKKMIRYQTERKVHFSRSKTVSQPCKELIWTMLEADLSLRVPISQAMLHPWLEEARRKKAEEDAAAAVREAEQAKAQAKQSSQPQVQQQVPPSQSKGAVSGRSSIAGPTKAVDVTTAAGVASKQMKPTPVANPPPLQGTTDAT